MVGFGAGLTGYGMALPQILQNQQARSQMQQQQQARARVSQLLQALAGQQSGGGPGTVPIPGANPTMAPPLPSMPQTMPGGGATPPSLGGAMPAGTTSPGMPPPQMDLSPQALIRMLSTLPGNHSADFDAMKDMTGATYKPLSLEQTMAWKMMQEEGKNDRAGKNIDSRERIAGANNNTRSSIADRNLKAKYDKMDVDQLNNEVTRWTSRVNTLVMGNKTNTDEYKQAVTNLTAAHAAVNQKRTGHDLPEKSLPEFPPAADQPTQEDLEYTAKQNNMTVDEVKAKLGIK